MAGYQSALRQHIVENLNRVRRFAFAITGTPDDADDLLQATVERVLKKGAPDDADIGRWMMRICKNIWIDEMRARRVRVTAAEEGKVGDPEVVDGEKAMTDHLTLDQVNTAMSALPEDQRMIISLVALDGCSYRQAAEVLEMPMGTVMSRLARARKALSDRLTPQTGGNENETGDDPRKPGTT